MVRGLSAYLFAATSEKAVAFSTSGTTFAQPQCADVFAFPSRDEGLGSVMLEALSTGVPVVANLMPGITDWLITPGIDGVLTTLTPSAFAMAVQQAVPLKERSSEIAARAAQRFDAALIDEGYWSLLTRLAAFKVAPPAKGAVHESDARSKV